MATMVIVIAIAVLPVIWLKPSRIIHTEVQHVDSVIIHETDEEQIRRILLDMDSEQRAGGVSSNNKQVFAADEKVKTTGFPIANNEHGEAHNSLGSLDINDVQRECDSILDAWDRESEMIKAENKQKEEDKRKEIEAYKGKYEAAVEEIKNYKKTCYEQLGEMERNGEYKEVLMRQTDLYRAEMVVKCEEIAKRDSLLERDKPKLYGCVRTFNPSSGLNSTSFIVAKNNGLLTEREVDSISKLLENLDDRFEQLRLEYLQYQSENGNQQKLDRFPKKSRIVYF